MAKPDAADIPDHEHCETDHAADTARLLAEIELAARRLAEIAKDDAEREVNRHLAIIAAGRRWR
ncbi:MAG: hypothetical protein M0Z28_25470 [Rhodospirillales bacterium]|jgi:hypothetical protein|nr:hypothetical protein [Rhodospirillales bacterium]